MRVNKQTVWLISMLTLMVVLSAYYVVTGPVEPANQPVAEKSDDPVQVNIQEVEEAQEVNQKSEVGSSDYFIGYHLQRNAMREKLAEDCYDVLMNPKASKTQLTEANQKLDQLTQLDKQESVVEEMIRGKGYKDVVVIKNENHVDVVVQSNQLAKNQVVQLIDMVGKQMKMPARQISITYRS